MLRAELPLSTREKQLSGQLAHLHSLCLSKIAETWIQSDISLHSLYM